MRSAGLLFGLWIFAALAQAAPPPLAVAPARYETVHQEQVFDALLEAVNQSTVSAQTSGRVEEINFDVDDYVEKGSVLLRLRDTEQRAALTAAQARYSEAQAEFERTRDVYEKKLVAKSAYDKAEAALKAALAARDQAREQLNHTVVTAPYSGIVVKRHIELGETASPGQPLMTGLSLERLRAIASVPQGFIAKVRKLNHARVILSGHDAESLDAQKLTFSPYADPQSHTFQVRVELPAGDHGVYPGMFCKVAFLTGEETRLLVPAQAIAYRGEVTAVYVVEPDGRIHFRQVRVGRVHAGGHIEVLAGLDQGEQVALEPVQAGVRLKEMRAGNGS